MKIAPFALERYFAQYEFKARHLLSCSDCEPLALAELLEMADAESLGLWKALKLSYTEAPGHPLLREAAAELYPGLSREQILVAAPEEAIFLTMQALLEPGQHLICAFPGYQSLYEIGRSLGCEVSFWTPEEHQGWRFQRQRLEELLRPETRLVVVNFPHNPTGALLDRQTWAALVAMVRQQGAWLLSDEMYRFLELDQNATLPAACTLYEKAITLSGLSKSFGLPGLRIGWIATQDAELLEHMSRLKDYTTICNSAPSEILGLMALRSRNRIIAAQMARIRQNLAELTRFMDFHADEFDWNPPQGGSICFPKLRTAEGATAFCRKLIHDQGIMLVPSTLFGYGDHHVRFGFGRADFTHVLPLLSTYLRQGKFSAEG